MSGQATHDKALGDDVVHAAVVVREGQEISRDYVREYVRSKVKEHMQVMGKLIIIN